MSVLIKGMEMPDSCYDCPLCYDNMACMVATKCYIDLNKEGFHFCEERHPDCPLISVDMWGTAM